MVTLYGLCFQMIDYYDIIQRFWKNSLYPVAENVEIEYSDITGDEVRVDILKNNKTISNKNENRLFVRYERGSGNHMQHTQLIEDFGDRFKSLVFKQARINLPPRASTLAREMFFGNFIDHICCHCPNLLDLLIVKCQLQRIDFSIHSLDQRLRLQTLCISECELNDNVFVELSTASRYIAHLKLNRNIYYFDEETPQYNVDINMSNTAIRTLTIDFSNGQKKSVYVKVFTLALKEYHYFKYDFRRTRDGILRSSSVDERTDNYNFFIHIQCQVLNRLVVVNDNQSASSRLQRAI